MVWLTERHPDSPLVSQVVLGLIALAGGVIGSYVFGATWDDANARIWWIFIPLPTASRI